jgi:hypothetical protein
MLFPFQRQHLSRHEKYPHIVNVKTTENASPQHEISEVKAYDCKTIDMEGLPLIASSNCLVKSICSKAYEALLSLFVVLLVTSRLM